jgi:dCMP deaminase
MSFPTSLTEIEPLCLRDAVARAAEARKRGEPILPFYATLPSLPNFGWAQFRELVHSVLAPSPQVPPRLSSDDYAMALAYVASLRSEDPKRKVGAVALNQENRVIATAYNGLVPGVTMSDEWWSVDSNRRTFVLHAESNLCSLTSRGDVETVAVTTAPCGPCMLNLIAHGVKRVIYGESYLTDPSGEHIAEFYQGRIVLKHVPLSKVHDLLSIV